MDKRSAVYIFIHLLMISSPGKAQMRVVVADFKNESDQIFLDSWQRRVPDLLRNALSQFPEITILERHAVFKEQELALAGFVNDSALVKQVGNLAGADVILSGSIYKNGNAIRIDANIIRVKTTTVKTERVQSPDSRHLNTMINLLANNIRFRLSAAGKYIERLKTTRYPVGYFLAASVGFTAATILTNRAYHDNLDKYHKTASLAEFDRYYDKANNAHRLTLIMGTLAGGSLFGTVFFWIKNKLARDIISVHSHQKSIAPGVSYLPGKGACLSVQIRF